MQKARGQAFRLPGIALPPLVGMWFQVQCPPLVGVLPIFRSRYSFAIGRQRVLSLAGWAPRIRAYFHVSGSTQVPNGRISLAAYGTITLYGTPFQVFLLGIRNPKCGPTTPEGYPPGLGSSAFARRY